MKNTLALVGFEVRYEHIKAHQDDVKSFDDLELMSQLNVMADQLAKRHLLTAVKEEDFIVSRFPNERCRVYCDGRKIHSSVRSMLYQVWGRKIAREILVDKGVLDEEGFALVNWEAVGMATTKLSPGFLSWNCKMASCFLPVNRMVARMDPSESNLCPCCRRKEETTKHLTRCKEQGRTRMFRESVETMVDWMESTGTEPILMLAVEEYLMGRGRVRMVDILEDEDDERYVQYAEEHDKLGWDNFVGGRVSATLFIIQEEWFKEAKSSRTIKHWAGQFVLRLLEITHRQWVFRCTKMHLKKIGNRTEREHLQIMEEVKEMLLTDPRELLPQHQFLLEEDFLRLGEGGSEDRLLWLEQMEKAIEARRSVRGGSEGGISRELGDETEVREGESVEAGEGRSPPPSQKRTAEVPSRARKAGPNAPLVEGKEGKRGEVLSETQASVCPRRSRMRLRSSRAKKGSALCDNSST